MKKLFISLLSVLSAGLINSSCEMPDAELGISQDFMTHVNEVNFVTDTSGEASGTLMTDLDNTKVTITGPDASKVYNIEGKKDFVITGGKIQLLLDPSADFVSKKAYTINLTVEKAGYLKRIVPITFNKEQNDSSYEVAMLKETSLPAGVSLATNTAGTVDGTGLITTINLTASNAATDGVTTSITIPAGVKMKDASGATLSGKLEAKVISFSETGNTTAYYPGGLTPTNIDMSDGTTESGTFVSAGFAAIHMSVGGKKVKTFEGGKVAVKMTLSKTNYNPMTEKPFEAEDKIDIWSYDEDKAQWKFESTGTVKKDTDDSLYVAFETSHLSYFNLDYLFRGDQGKCPNYMSYMTFNWSANVASVNCRFVFTSLATGTTTSSYWDQRFLAFQNTIYKGQRNIVYYPPVTATRLDIYDISNGKLLLTKQFAKRELCTNPVINLDVPNPPTPVTVTLRYQGMCTATNTKVLPPMGTCIYYREKGTSIWRQFHYVSYFNRYDTKISTQLLTVGKTYDFYIFVGSLSTQKTYTITKADYFIDVKLPNSICTALTR